MARMMFNPTATAEANHGPLDAVGRRVKAWTVRKSAADFQLVQPLANHATNGDEARYSNRIGNYHKSLPHNSFGEVNPSAYQSFRNARAGEVGDRNTFRLPNYWTVDLGLGKSFTMPWNENHKFIFRWEVFNVANFQPLGALLFTRDGFGLGQDPNLNEPSVNFGNFTGIHPFAQPRVMQFGLRYQF